MAARRERRRCGWCARWCGLCEDTWGDRLGACSMQMGRDLGVECETAAVVPWLRTHLVSRWRDACGEWEARDGVPGGDEGRRER